MCCVGRKKFTGKKVVVYVFHIYYTPERHSVYNHFWFVFVFDVLFCFFFICLCVFFVLFLFWYLFKTLIENQIRLMYHWYVWYSKCGKHIPRPFFLWIFFYRRNTYLRYYIEHRYSININSIQSMINNKSWT
jgi:hypothetical protein